MMSRPDRLAGKNPESRFHAETQRAAETQRKGEDQDEEVEIRSCSSLRLCVKRPLLDAAA
jgi:hypothetical protein